MKHVASNDIRSFLQSELVRRCKSNRKYSLRAFAKLLEVESSALSKILRGKRSVTHQMLNKIGQKLAVTPSRMQTFESAMVERRGRQRNGNSRPTSTPEYRELELDYFQVISDWYHLAILELIAIEEFEPKVSWIARTLDISHAEAQEAVDRLIRVGLLIVSKDGRWVDRAGNMTAIQSGLSTAAARKFQLQTLSKAMSALEEVPIEFRDNTGMTMAIDRSLLPEAREKIANFRRELCEFLQSGNKKDQVYQMNIALYPLTTKNLIKKNTQRGK
jgi:uncharacterized protein (TIGR02147 family)